MVDRILRQKGLQQTIIQRTSRDPGQNLLIRLWIIWELIATEANGKCYQPTLRLLTLLRSLYFAHPCLHVKVIQLRYTER